MPTRILTWVLQVSLPWVPDLAAMSLPEVLVLYFGPRHLKVYLSLWHPTFLSSRSLFIKGRIN
jgi:hypothetical protein